MEKLPFFGVFKDSITKAGKEIKMGWQNKQLFFLTLYFIILLLLSAIFISGTFVTINSGITAYKMWFPTKVTQTVPKKTLTYERKNKTKDEEGLFHATFNIMVHTPAGNNIQNYTLFNAVPDPAECLLTQKGRIFEANGGLASTTDLYEATCITKEPLIDSGHLFSVTENYQP